MVATKGTEQASSSEGESEGESVEDPSAIATMTRRGLTLVPIPPAAEAEWRAMAESFYPKIRGDMVPADMFAEVTRLVAEYRAAHPGR